MLRDSKKQGWISTGQEVASKCGNRQARNRNTCNTIDKMGTSTVVEKGQLMQKDIRKIKEQTRMVKAVGIKKQGSWLN